jgi:hypothetical protein
MLLLTYFILPAHYRRPVPSAAEYSLPCKGIFFGSLKSMNACRQFKSEHLPYCQQYGHNGELVNEGRYITQLMQTKSRSNVPLGKPLDAVTATNGPLTRHRLSAHRLFRNIPNAKQRKWRLTLNVAITNGRMHEIKAASRKRGLAPCWRLHEKPVLSCRMYASGYRLGASKCLDRIFESKNPVL